MGELTVEGQDCVPNFIDGVGVGLGVGLEVGRGVAAVFVLVLELKGRLQADKVRKRETQTMNKSMCPFWNG